jgi:hypothetical protein
MKRCSILVVTLLLTTCMNAAAQDASELVARCVETIGGPEAIAKYSDFEAEGEIKFSRFGREMSGSLRIIQQQQKRWQRTEMQFGRNVFVMVSAFDGKTAFSEMRGTISDTPTLNYESDLDHTFAVLVAADAEFTLGRTTEIEGRQVIGVEATSGGKTTTFFIDAESSSVTEIVFEDEYFGDTDTKEMLEKRIRFSDYTEIDGIMFPKRRTHYEKGMKGAELVFDSVTFAPQVSPERFERPAKELDLRYGEERLS